MQLEIFRGRDLDGVVRRLRRELGEDALILGTTVLDRSGFRVFEVKAARAGDISAFPHRLGRGGPRPPWERRDPERIGPSVVALVGPPGVGKTTSCMKLALNDVALGGLGVGLVTLDTLRVGAVDELQVYAGIARLPLEVAYRRHEVAGIVQRLRDRDVLVLDTPGRGPERSGPGDWLDVLRDFRPDEIHLVLPSGLRMDVVRETARTWAPCEPTHLLVTGVDQPGGTLAVPRIAEELDLPVRWVSTGHRIPSDLENAGAHVAASSGDAVA